MDTGWRLLVVFYRIHSCRRPVVTCTWTRTRCSNNLTASAHLWVRRRVMFKMMVLVRKCTCICVCVCRSSSIPLLQCILSDSSWHLIHLIPVDGCFQCASKHALFSICWMLWSYDLRNAYLIITGPPNEPVLFCLLAYVVCRRRLSSSVMLPAGGPAGRRRRARGRSSGQHCAAGQYGYVPLGWHLVIIA